MNLALSSDFPSTVNQDLVDRIQAIDRNPRIAWLTRAASTSRIRFPLAKVAFRTCGIKHLEYVAVGNEPAEAAASVLDRYDVVYLTGGDPVLFRENLQSSGLAMGLRQFAATGRLVIGASGGAMQLTRNVSLFRLLSGTVDEVVSRRGEFEGLGFVDYEILPHLNRHDQGFLEKVHRYSEFVPHDIVALEDGSVVVSDEEHHYRCLGRAVRYRGGAYCRL